MSWVVANRFNNGNIRYRADNAQYFVAGTWEIGANYTLHELVRLGWSRSCHLELALFGVPECPEG